MCSKILALTADNASVNVKMGRLLSEDPDVDFEEDQLLGCCGHVINLAAKEGLKVFGDDSALDEDSEDRVPSTMSVLVDPPDNAFVKLKTIYARIHGLAIYTRKTPQRSQAFSSVIKLVRSFNSTSEEHGISESETVLQEEAFDFFQHRAQVNPDEEEPVIKQDKSANRINRLSVNVPTRWNSSYLMLKRSLLLKQACIKYCERREASRFSLNPLEWNYVQQMCDFLEPLSEATDMFCKRKFPTMQEVIPIYTVVIEGLIKVQSLQSLLVPLRFCL